MLVAPDVDALCASRILATLFKQDDVIHRIIPISCEAEFKTLKNDLLECAELHALILINMGSISDLPDPVWFGDFSPKVTVHVIDSSRPRSLDNYFMRGENGERIVVWDDMDAETLVEEREAWEVLRYEPEPDSEEEEESEEDEEEESNDDEGSFDLDQGATHGKRKATDENRASRKRQRRNGDAYQVSHEERERCLRRLGKYYSSGSWHGQSAASTIYILATILERVDNDFLWLAILGLTFQYITSRISRDSYEKYHSIFHDEVSRLNPAPTVDADNPQSVISLNPDDLSIRATEELRFTLFRHWTLYDAMYHSSYVASKLGIWKERGRKKLSGMLAKMGFSIPQTQQPYSHMDLDLKKDLIKKLNDFAPEYELLELLYPSFIRCYGYHSQPLSAADAVEGIGALLDIAGGVRMEVEIEGARNGGEWFGAGSLWEASKYEQEGGRKADVANRADREAGEEGTETTAKGIQVPWWVKNFWAAHDALADITSLREALNLSMSLHRAIIRQGTSIIDKQDIRTMRNHRVVVLTQGPDLALFSHPSVLARLALWLVDALRDRIGTKRRSLPFVVACLDEAKGSYTVVGVMAALDFGEVCKNDFAMTFLHARDRSKAEVKHTSFDTSVIEVEQNELTSFLEALTEG